MAAQYYTTSSNTGFNAALKEFYLPRFLSTINENRILMSRLERDTSKTDVSGRHARVPVNIRPSQAIGARADSSSGPALPTPQSQTWVEVQIGYAFNYGTVRITHPVIQASRNDRGAFLRAVGSEMDGIRRDLKNDINRQLFGDGNGVLGISVGSGSSATSLVLQAGHKVKIGMALDSFAAKSGGSAQIDSQTVSALATSTNTATIGTDSWDDNSYIYREDSRGNEMMGLLGIVDADAATTTFVSTLQNVDRSASSGYPEWDAQVLANAGTARALTEDLLDQAILQTEEQADADISLMITSSTQFRKIGQMLTPDRRYSPTMELDGGFTAINWANIPIVWDRDCPRTSQVVQDGSDMDMLFGVDESSLAIYQLADWDFDDTDGNVMHRRQDVAAYDATLFYYGQLGTTDPANNFVIRDLTR